MRVIMGIEQSMGLLALLGIPFLIFLYMLKPKFKEKKIPSTYLWSQVKEAMDKAATLSPFRYQSLIWLQMLAVLICALLLADFYIGKETVPKELIIVMDGSISMQKEDVTPNRFTQSQNMAIDFVNQLDGDHSVTLIYLGKTPEILIRETQSPSVIRDAIKALQVTAYAWNGNQVVGTLNGYGNIDASGIHYFGDHPIAGATNHLVGDSSRNMGLSTVTVSKNESKTNQQVLITAFNESDVEQSADISLYGDDAYIGTKTIQIGGEEEGRIIFDKIPASIESFRAQLDGKDILPIDNVAYGGSDVNDTVKVAYIGEGNLFLEKILNLRDDFEVSSVSYEDGMILEGYDLYIWDGVLPTQLPEKGNYILFDPPERSFIPKRGVVSSPQFSTKEGEWMKELEDPEFRVSTTQVFDDSLVSKVLYDTDHGAMVYVSEEVDRVGVVFGFDIRYSDLPLTVDYPILMNQIFSHLVSPSISDRSTYTLGESMEFQFLPTIREASLIYPSKREESLNVSEREVDYANGNELGLYQLVYGDGKQQAKAYIGMNAPHLSFEDVSLINGQQTVIVSKDRHHQLTLILGSLLLVILLTEWYIYHKRRKKHADTHE